MDSVQQGSATPLDETPGHSTVTMPGANDAGRDSSLPPIVLGKDMAAELGAPVGSVVTITSPQGELTPFGIVPKYKRFKVAGIFSSGFYDYDNTWAFIRLADAQRLFDLSDVVSVMEFKVDDIYQAGAIGRTLETEAGKGFMSTNWMEQNRALFHALRLERIVTFITIGLIVFVAALNILISLIMMVMEKTRDIAVLVSMGAKRRQIRRIFIYQGLLIGVIGTALGLIAGYAAVVGRRTLSPVLALRRGVLHRLRPLRAAFARRPAGGSGRYWRVVHCDAVSLLVGSQCATRRGTEVRVSSTSYFVLKGRSFSCAVASPFIFVITRRTSVRRGICFSTFSANSLAVTSTYEHQTSPRTVLPFVPYLTAPARSSCYPLSLLFVYIICCARTCISLWSQS